MSDRSERLRRALVGLKRGSCFCEAGIGNPMVSTHTRACREAQAALDAELLRPPRGDCASEPETRGPVRCRIAYYADADGRNGWCCTAAGCGAWGPLGEHLLGTGCHFDRESPEKT